MKILYFIFSITTGMIGHTIHGSYFWAFIDFWLVPIVWVKWILYHQVTLTIIKETFGWFFV